MYSGKLNRLSGSMPARRSSPHSPLGWEALLNVVTNKPWQPPRQQIMLLVHTACCGLGALLHGSPSKTPGDLGSLVRHCQPQPFPACLGGHTPALAFEGRNSLVTSSSAHRPLGVSSVWSAESFLGSVQDSPPGFLPHMAHVWSMAHTHIYPAFWNTWVMQTKWNMRLKTLSMCFSKCWKIAFNKCNYYNAIILVLLLSLIKWYG